MSSSLTQLLSLLPPSFPSNSPLHKLDQALHCQICKGVLEGSVSLVCGHTFCSRCIRSAIASKLKTCPTCADPIRGEGDLRRNRLVEEVVESWGEARPTLLDLLASSSTSSSSRATRRNQPQQHPAASTSTSTPNILPAPTSNPASRKRKPSPSSLTPLATSSTTPNPSISITAPSPVPTGKRRKLVVESAGIIPGRGRERSTLEGIEMGARAGADILAVRKVAGRKGVGKGVDGKGEKGGLNERGGKDEPIAIDLDSDSDSDSNTSHPEPNHTGNAAGSSSTSNRLSLSQPRSRSVSISGDDSRPQSDDDIYSRYSNEPPATQAPSRRPVLTPFSLPYSSDTEIELLTPSQLRTQAGTGSRGRGVTRPRLEHGSSTSRGTGGVEGVDGEVDVEMMQEEEGEEGEDSGREEEEAGGDDPDRLIPCPICVRQIPFKYINIHIDRNCTYVPRPSTTRTPSISPIKPKSKRSTNPSTSTAAPPDPKSTWKKLFSGTAPTDGQSASGGSPAAAAQPIKRPNLALATPKQLRELLEEWGLGTRGEKGVLGERVGLWVGMFNANLDSSHPKTMKALRAELDKVEKARGKDREDARKAKEVMDGVGMGGVVESSGGGEDDDAIFRRLTREIREREKKRKEAAAVVAALPGTG